MKRALVRMIAAATAAMLAILPCALSEEDLIAAQIAGMTLREKVGQLFIIRPDALEGQFSNADLEDNSIRGTSKVTDEMMETYQRYPCGGFALFRKNLVGPAQLRKFTLALHGLGAVRPVLAIDEEGGRIARIANFPGSFVVPKYESMGDIAASGDAARAWEVGAGIGAYLKDFGLDIDFAPVADVNTNPRNPVIGDRAFGNDPEMAAQMVVNYLLGLQDQGVMGCLKHFPGHGDTATDTHTGYAETLKTWEEILSCEMIPFRAGIAAGAEVIMTAHIAAPNVTGSSEPSTVSYTILTEKLRNELGYQGLIITDALSMGAITKEYTSAQVCVRCVQAGADWLLMPYDYFEAFDGLVRAVETGEISEERIDESVYRILSFKARHFAE